MKARGHIKGSPLQLGPLFQKSSSVFSFATFVKNGLRLKKLNKRWKLFRGEDGWFAKGRLGQVWEYGSGKFGFTVASGMMTARAIDSGFTPTQLGDGEANFACEWTDQNIDRLRVLLKLRIRRGPPKEAFGAFQKSTPGALGGHQNAPE
jgi:hypothetical protein